MWLLAIPLLLTLGWFSPWWLVVVAALGAGFARRRMIGAAGAGFAVAAVSWGLVIAVLEFQSRGIVAYRLAGLFGLSNQYLFVVAVVIGAGVVGLVAGVLGQWLRRLSRVSK